MECNPTTFFGDDKVNDTCPECGELDGEHDSDCTEDEE